MKINAAAAVLFVLFCSLSDAKTFKIGALHYGKADCRGDPQQGVYFGFRDKIADGTCKSKNHHFRSLVISRHKPFGETIHDWSQFGICDVKYFADDDCEGEEIGHTPGVNERSSLDGTSCIDLEGEAKSMSLECHD